MVSFLAADFSDYSVLVFGTVSVAVLVAGGRFLARRAQRAAMEQFSSAVTSIVTEIVNPQMEAMRAQNRQLQQTLEDNQAQNARDHASVVNRLEAVEHRLPPPPPDFPPPPQEHR